MSLKQSVQYLRAFSSRARGASLYLLATLLFFNAPAYSLQSAEQIFEAIEPSVYQIQIIETKSASQVSLGTGFLVGENLVATNYHVVSSVVLEPKKHRAQIKDGEQELALEVVTVDVVNDLALLKTKDIDLVATPFALASGDTRQGSILYSLGNPHNIGMTVVQGNYNGFAEHSFLERIHFSGAVNPGMSGGPTVNGQAEVVGINVASSGNQIGFLVPVKHLQALISKAAEITPQYSILHDMAGQIGANTDAMVQALLEAPWDTEPMGDAIILGKLVDWMDCWGDSNEDLETGVTDIARGCSNTDNIFVGDRLTTGFFEYEFFYKEASDWPQEAFYRAWRINTASAVPGNRAGKKYVENYECIDRTLKTRRDGVALSRRASYCVRPYKKLPGLFDVFFMGASTDKENKAVMDHFTLAGVTEQSAQAFLERFAGVVAWQ